MADITITAASVLKSATTVIEHGTAGATITAGQVVYLDSSDSEYKLADTDSATAAVRSPRGIALNNASDGQPMTIARKGPVTIGGTLAAATTYYLSGTPGGIAPIADVASGDYTCILGIATSTTVLDINIIGGDVALA